MGCDRALLTIHVEGDQRIPRLVRGTKLLLSVSFSADFDHSLCIVACILKHLEVRRYVPPMTDLHLEDSLFVPLMQPQKNLLIPQHRSTFLNFRSLNTICQQHCTFYPPFSSSPLPDTAGDYIQDSCACVRICYKLGSDLLTLRTQIESAAVSYATTVSF